VCSREAVEQRDYLISEEIGQGAYATVHIPDYTDETSAKKVRLACKIFIESNPTKCPSEKFLQRELHILTKIENPNIIHVHSTLRLATRIFIFMSFRRDSKSFKFYLEELSSLGKNKPECGSVSWQVGYSISIQRTLYFLNTSMLN
jgi:serine/threonine protein kinase